MDWTDYIEELIQSRIERIEQGLVCKIQSFDKQAMRADVVPFIQEKREGQLENYPTLPGVPVAYLFSGEFYIRPHYLPDDLVWVTFATRDIESSLRETVAEESPKRFDLENACVIGGVAPTGFTAPDEFSEDGLLIGHTGGDAYIQFESDKMTALFDAGSKKVELSDGGMRFFNGSVWTNFMTHVHPTAATGPPSPPTVGT
jgi:hypothetical protein